MSSQVKMRRSVAGKVASAGGVVIALAQTWEGRVDDNTSAVGGRVQDGLRQRKRLGFHARGRTDRSLEMEK